MVNSKEQTSPVRHSREDGNPVHVSSKANQKPLDIKYQLSNISPLVVIVGETASGKTAAAIEVAKRVNGEIICADSRTIYKKMDISTAKPTLKEQQGITHHLLNVIEPDEVFSAAKFQELANKCIREITDRGKIPIIVGGTGLYIDAVLYNFHFGSEADAAYRTHLEQMNDDELTTILNTKNIDTTHLNTKNRRHVIRAIERGNEVPVKQKLRKNTLVLGITLDREILRERITKRTEQMFHDGFLSELKTVADQYGWGSESITGSGYVVAKDYFDGVASEEDVKAAFIKRDMGLAKRQRTWFKRSSDINWFEDKDELIDRAVSYIGTAR